LWGAVSSITPEPNWALASQQSLPGATSSAVATYNQQALLQQQQMVLHNSAEAELQTMRQQVAQAQQFMMERQSQIEQLQVALRNREQMLMQ
jgi:hypothetical protein